MVVSILYFSISESVLHLRFFFALLFFYNRMQVDQQYLHQFQIPLPLAVQWLPLRMQVSSIYQAVGHRVLS